MNALCVSKLTSRRGSSLYSFGFLAARLMRVDGLGTRGLRSREMRETKGDSK
jgi:hypothetical protein